MPTSASNNLRNGQQGYANRSRQSRPNAAGSAPSAPLLFRFPAIDTSRPLSAVAAEMQRESASTSREQSEYDREAGFAEAALSESVNSPVSASAFAYQQPAVSTSQTAVAEAEEGKSSEDVRDKEALALANEGSWWEHWSSGVVLVLLIIALVTASIIAFNDGSATQNDELLAGGEADAATTDLDTIDIPDVNATDTVVAANESQVGDQSGSSAMPEMLFPNPAVEDGLQLTGNVGDPQTGAAMGSQPAGAQNESLIPDLNFTQPEGNSQAFLLGGDNSAPSGESEGSLVSSESIRQALTNATLSTPEAQERKVLFPELPQNQTYSGPSSTNSTQAGLGSRDTNMQPLESILGLSPEGAKASSAPTSNPQGQFSSQTSSAPYGSSGRTVAASTVSHSAPATAQPASYTTPVTSTPQETGAQSIRTTNTPNSYEQELLQRYREFKSTPSAPKTAPSQNQTPASSIGYPPY